MWEGIKACNARAGFCGKEEVMAQIKFILEELYRSFWNSWLKDILLMAMFCTSLVMAVLMCSYYFDLGERRPSQAEYGGSTWYQFGVSFAEDSSQEDYMNSLQTASGCRNMMGYYDALCNAKEHPILSMYQEPFSIKEAHVKELFGDRDIIEFLQEGQEGAVSVYDADGSSTCLVRNFKAYAANLGAYQSLGLKAVEGEGFTEENLGIQDAGDGIPILVGYGYKGLLSVGQGIDVKGREANYRCRVAGILEKGAQFPKSDFSDVETVSLDSYILFPIGVQVENEAGEPGILQELAWACIEALSSGHGIIKVGDEKELHKTVDAVRKVGEEFGLPPIKIFGVSMGLSLLRKESAVRIQMMMILTVVLFCLTFYGLFVMFYDKVQSNGRVYGIYLMNGCPMGIILVPCLLEVALILLPGLLVSGYVFAIDSVGGSGLGVILGTAYGITGGAFLVGAGGVLYLMRGVDTEHLVRQKD